MNHRLIRVSELIKRELGTVIIKEIQFPIPLVSVRGVNITADLKRAHVYISALGNAQQKEQVMLELEHHRAHLQRELSKRVILKNTPTLFFELDESIERGTRVMEILDQIDQELPPEEESESSEEPRDEEF